jgi:serine/threonine protein kinase
MKATESIEYRVGEPMPGTKWVVRGKLGQGGMGVVLDVAKGDWIPGAMKVLRPSFAKVPEFAARFLAEVRVTAQLQHPNIVQVLDFDRLEDGTPFMVMERLRGRTLHAALRETRQRGKTWSAANTYAVATQVCEGLNRAHSHAPPIVHRDVKPDNVFLHRAEGSLEPVVKVMDFGVAAVLGERDPRAIGTPKYMAPEQMSGQPVSPQTDQYALALIVYEMLTGRLPWEVNVREPEALTVAHVRARPLPAARFCTWLPERVDRALLKALAMNPAERHESVHGLLFELRMLQWAGDGSRGVSDANTTDPTVGTLADALATLQDEHDTQEKMSPPPLEGRSLELPELSAESPVSVEFVEQSKPRKHEAAAVENVDDSAETRELRRSPAPTKGVPLRRDAEAMGSQSNDTPMTGESGSDRAAARGKSWQILARRGAPVVLASCAVVAVLVTVAVALIPRAHGVKNAERSQTGTLSSPLATSPMDPPAGATVPAEPAAQVASSPLPPSWVGSAEAPAANLQTKRAVPVPTPGRAPAAPVRPSPRPSATAKNRVRDDGRDELYVPEAR